MSFVDSPTRPDADLRQWLERVETRLDGTLAHLTTQLTGLHREAESMGQAIRRAALGGKLIRSRLLGTVLTSYEVDLDEQSEQVAVLLELMHTALVIHDDVIDDDLSRRGKPNVAGEFARLHPHPESAEARNDGKAIALVAGDVVLTVAFGILRSLPDEVRDQCSELLERALLAAAVGEHLDVVHSWPDRRVDPVDTRRAAHLKTTVYSFEAPLVTGLLLARAPRSHRAGVEEAARYMGEAYQVVDDILGAFAHDTVLGRERASDLELHRETAVIVAARLTEDWDRIERLRYRTVTPESLLALRSSLLASGAKDIALHRARALVGTADDELRSAGLPESLCAGITDLLHSMVSRAE